MNLFFRKVLISLGVCATFFTVSLTSSPLYAFPSISSDTLLEYAVAFNQLTPEQQKEQIAQLQKSLSTIQEQVIQQLPSLEQQKQMEAKFLKARQQLDTLMQLSPEQRTELAEKIGNNVYNQLNDYTSQQKN